MIGFSGGRNGRFLWIDGMGLLINCVVFSTVIILLAKESQQENMNRQVCVFCHKGEFVLIYLYDVRYSMKDDWRRSQAVYRPIVGVPKI
jgi:membrane protein DedA with SNARE-associated domain